MIAGPQAIYPNRSSTGESWPRMIPAIGHSASIDSLTTNDNGKLLLTASRDGSVVLWDVATGAILQRYIGHSASVHVAKFSVDGTQIITGSSDRSIRFWDMKTGDELRRFQADIPVRNLLGEEPLNAGTWSGVVHSINLTADGNHLIASTDSGHWLLNTLSPDPVRTFSWRRLGRQLDVSGDTNKAYLTTSERYLVSRYNLGGLLVWDVTTGTQITEIKFDHEDLVAWVLAPNKDEVFTGHSDGSIRTWNLRTGTEVLTAVQSGMDRVDLMQVSNDGRYLLAARSKTLTLIDLSSRLITQTWHHYSDIAALSFSPVDSNVFYTAGYYVVRYERGNDKLTGLWAGNNYEPAKQISLGTAGRKMIIGYLGGDVRIIDLITGRQTHHIEDESNGLGLIEHISLSPDNRFAIIGYVGFNDLGEIDSKLDVTLIWDLTTDSEYGRTSFDIKNIAFSPTKEIAVIANDLGLWLWDRTADPELRNISGGLGSLLMSGFEGVAFTPDGKHLVASYSDAAGGIHVYDVDTWRKVRSFDGPFLVRGLLTGHKSWIQDLAIDSTGTRLISGSWDKTARLRDFESGKVLHIFRHESWVDRVAFSAAGEYALSVAQNDAKVWNAKTGALILQIKGPGQMRDAVFVSPRLIASVAADSIVRIWDLEKKSEVVAYAQMNNDWIAYSSNGLFDGTGEAWRYSQWRMSPDTLQALPLEAFFNEYFYPGLLPAILSGDNPAPQRALGSLDRRQPTVWFETTGLDPEAPIEDRWINLDILVAENRDGPSGSAGSGARDIRLFRNHSLIRTWRGDVLQGKPSTVLKDVRIRLIAGENIISVYGFNNDNIKSRDFQVTLQGAKSLQRQGIAHVLAVGVGENENASFALETADNDAFVFHSRVSSALSGAGWSSDRSAPILNDQATRTGIVSSLNNLASRVNPEDMVIIYISSHGFAFGDRYFIVPYDTKFTGSRATIDEHDIGELASMSISDRDLSDAIEGIDARHLILIIDACNSGQALENPEKRRGPMNSTGLAQVAYEKGMYILVAAQTYQQALATIDQGHSFLVLSLIEEALAAQRADRSPKDNKITVEEWFDYAVATVPVRHSQLEQRKRLIGDQLAALIEGKDTPDSAPADMAIDSMQTPKAYYRREIKLNPAVISVSSTSRAPGHQ